MKKIFYAILSFLAKMFRSNIVNSAKPGSAANFGEEFLAEQGKTEWQVEVVTPFVVPNEARKGHELAAGVYTLILIPARFAQNRLGATTMHPAKLKVVGYDNVAPIPYWQTNILKGRVRILS